MGNGREEEYLRRMKALGYEPSLAGMDDDDIEWELDRMDGKNSLQEARPAERPLYPRYKPADPAMVARIYRQMGRPYDASLIPEEEKYYIGGWDNGDDDDDAAPQAKPSQNPFTPQQSGGRQPDKPWTLNWGGNGNMFGAKPQSPSYRPEQPGTTFPSRGAVERPLVYGSGDNNANTGYQLTNNSGPASYRRDGLRMAYSQPSAAASKKYIQEWYDANIWTDPDVLSASTPADREAAIHRIIASRGGEGLLKHYNALHINENDAEAARMNDVKYVVNSLGRVQDMPDGNTVSGAGRDNKDKLNAAIEKAINITGSFEGHAGYENVAGNADGAGLSLGKFQWNIGQETLQPMLAKFINENPEKAREIFGKNFESVASMLSGTKADQMNWARSINGNEGKLLPEWQAQFTNLCKTKEFQEMQRSEMTEYINKAHDIAKEFNLKSERGLALALDIAVQNGSVDATDYIKQRMAKGASEAEILRLMANAVADQSNPRWGEDVRARKLAIANGRGRVHGKDYDLGQEFGLTDDSYR